MLDEMETLPVATEELSHGIPLILAILNTRYGQQKRLHDEWPDHAAMEEWLRERGLIAADGTVTDGDYRRAIALREALRKGLRRSDDHGTTADALETINHIARHALLKVHFSGFAQAQLAPESDGVDGVLARACWGRCIPPSTREIRRTLKFARTMPVARRSMMAHGITPRYGVPRAPVATACTRVPTGSRKRR
jgi:hypothetical protein